MPETKKTLVERLFAEHGGALQAFLFRRVRKHPDAAELAQEVYVRMLRVPDMESVRNPEAYLYTVASNLAKEHARHERRDGEVVNVDDPLVQEQLAELPSYAGQLDAQERIKRLREVLHQLSPKCQAAVVLQYWHGLLLRGNRAAAGGLHEHGEEVPEPGVGALSPSHVAAGMSL
jgi:RNA polymerase sigma factor (sigma-70 family)